MNEVVEFWFEELQPEDWFKKSDALDREMRERFEELYWKASRGELFHWRVTAEGRLAEIFALGPSCLVIFFEGLPKLLRQIPWPWSWPKKA